MMIGLVLGLVICVGLIVYMYKEAFADRVKYMELTYKDFPKGIGEVNIFFISDIHRREVKDPIIKEVIGHDIDLVIIGGDLLEKGVSFKKVKENIKRLKQLGPVYFVWGNNDYEADYHELDALLIDMGVKILDNSAVSFAGEGDERFVLLGTDDLSRERDRLDLAIEDAGEGGFRILVSHDPGILDKVKNEHNISLVLCGHTHGGQIRIFGIGPYELGGFSKNICTDVFISNGYGTTALPLRLGAESETHIINIKSA
nr:metallophosphoesterase [Cytobacillus purgationiresistens]